MTDERLSFRPIVAGERAWQRQLRDRRADPAPPGVELDLSRARIRRISREAAKRIILRYEWLGTMGAGAGYFYGLVFDDLYLAGVCCIAVGNGVAGRAHLGYGVGSTELAVLVRGAMASWAPPGANSKLVAWSIRLLREDAPRAKVIVAYADEEAGEIGTIYQAAGWTYCGRTGTRLDLVAPSGRLMNQVYLTRWSRQRKGVRIPDQMEALRKVGWTTQASSKKHRYAMVLDRSDESLVDRIASMELPYPRRPDRPVSASGGGESDDAPAVQVGEDASRRSRRSKRRAPDRTGEEV